MDFLTARVLEVAEENIPREKAEGIVRLDAPAESSPAAGAPPARKAQSNCCN